MGYTRHGRECQWLSIKSWPQKWKYSIHSASSSFFSDFLLNFRVFVFVCIYGSSLMLVEQVLTKCNPKRESRHNAFCCWQVRNLTAATGQSVNGVSPAPTSWPVTIGNTRAPNLSAARSANAVSPDPTISPCTWNGTYPRAPNANASALLYLIYYNVTNETIRRRNGDQHIISTRLYSNNLPVFVCMFVFLFFFTGVFHVHTALAQRPTQPKRGTSQSFSLSPFLSILFVLFLSLFWLTKRNIMRYTSLWISVYNNHPIGLSLCVHNGVCVCLIPIRLSLSLSLYISILCWHVKLHWHAIPVT